MDEEVKARFRKCKKNLELSGKAMIAFSLWALIKSFIPIIMRQKTLNEILMISEYEMEEYRVLLYVLFIGILFVVTLFYLKLGVGAINYSIGKRKKKGFLIMAFIVLVVTIATFPFYLIGFGIGNTDGDTTITSMIMDITLIVAIIDMISSTFTIDKLRKDYGLE